MSSAQRDGDLAAGADPQPAPAVPTRSPDPQPGPAAPPARVCIRCTHPTDPRAWPAVARRSCGVVCRICCTTPTAASQLVNDAPSDAPSSTPNHARLCPVDRCVHSMHAAVADASSDAPGSTRRVSPTPKASKPGNTARRWPAWAAPRMTAIPACRRRSSAMSRRWPEPTASGSSSIARNPTPVARPRSSVRKGSPGAARQRRYAAECHVAVTLVSLWPHSPSDAHSACASAARIVGVAAYPACASSRAVAASPWSASNTGSPTRAPPATAAAGRDPGSTAPAGRAHP